MTDEYEEKILLGEVSYLARLISNSNKVRSMNSITKGLIHYAAGQKARVDEIFKAIVNGLRDYDYDRIKPYLYILEHLLTTKFDYHDTMKLKWLNIFCKIVNQNLGFYKYIEVMFEFINKMSCKNQLIKNYFS